MAFTGQTNKQTKKNKKKKQKKNTNKQAHTIQKDGYSYKIAVILI